MHLRRQLLEVGFIEGSVTRGANLTPFKEHTTVLPFLKTGDGKMLSLLLMFAAVAMGVWAVGDVGGRRTQMPCTTVLSPYSGEVEQEVEGIGGHTAIFQRAVDITGAIAERRGLLTIAENKLDQASMPLRAAEALTG